MTDPNQDRVSLPRQDAESLARFLRQFETFLDDCDEEIGDAMDNHFGFSPVAESLSAVLATHADTLEGAIGSPTVATSRTPT